MEIKFKKINENAVTPKKAHKSDAGFDLTATSKEYDNDGNVVYGTGLAFEIPEGFVGLLFPRSSNSKRHLILSNCVGILDSGYRGEVMFKFKTTCQTINPFKLAWTLLFRKKQMTSEVINVFTNGKDYNIGDRIGQMIIIPYPEIEFIEAETLSESDRGEGGYGSTGK